MVINSITKDFVEILLNLDEKLDESSIMGVVMVHAPYSTLVVLTKCVEIHFVCLSQVCDFFNCWLTKCLLILINRICLWRTTKTTANALEWALSEFIFHPEMMMKAQQELTSFPSLSHHSLFMLWEMAR